MLPQIRWQWESETDILSGLIDTPCHGQTGTIELDDPGGAMAVLDLNDGQVRGVDIVVWPEVMTVPGLQVPEPAHRGVITAPFALSDPGVPAMQVRATLAIMVDETESVMHLQVGEDTPVDLIQVADHLFLTLDVAGHLTGCWLTGVPAPPGLD